MKGKLIYDQDGWWVQHKARGLDGNLEYIAESMLHPDDVKQIEKDSQMFDNIEARIAAYPDVEFEMVTETVASVGNSDEQDEYTITYAKLIPSKEQQKQLITEIMELDAKDGLYECTELDEFYYHEVLDRLTLVTDIIDRHLIDHPVCEKHTELKQLIEKAGEYLAEAYLKIPSLY